MMAAASVAGLLALASTATHATRLGWAIALDCTYARIAVIRWTT